MPIFRILHQRSQKDSVSHRTFVTAKKKQSNNKQSSTKKAAKSESNQHNITLSPHIITDSQKNNQRCSTKLCFLLTFLRLKKKKITDYVAKHNITFDNVTADTANPESFWLFAAQHNLGKYLHGSKHKKLLAALPKGMPPFLLKPSSTVTGFKKYMYSSVKYNDNQLQPGYNRRKFNHSHYNQTLKENSRLGKVYLSLSTTQLLNYLAFTGKNQILTQDYNLNNMIRGQTKTLPLCYAVTDRQSEILRQNRTIPKLVNYLESRLAVILWRSLFSKSITNSKQKLRVGTLVNASIQKKQSFLTLPGDVLCFPTCNKKQ